MKRLATVFAAVLLAVGQAGAETRVAVIGSQAAGVEKIVPLVELRLGQKKEVVLLERENIKEIFREQELQALMTAEGTAKRIALGKLLKADVLVILQGQDKPQPHARVTICETKQGLRLCNQPVEFSKDLEADADAVLRVVEKAIEKQQRPIDDIVAVPPFVNNTLAYEGDHLKAACARLIEELLMDRPSVLVVELAEAKAIAQELTLTGTGGTVQRRLPLYLLGEYRLEGAGEKRKVAFKLVLLRGSIQVDVRTDVAANVDELPQQVRDAAGAMLSKALGQAMKPPDPKAEAEQLAQRAQLSARVGLWDEALALTEAALLLKPDRYEQHGEAVLYINVILKEQERREEEESGTIVQTPAGGPTARLSKVLLPATLHHVEIYMRNTRLDDRKNNFRWLPGYCCERLLFRFGWQNREEFERSRAEFEPVMAMARRVLAAKAAAKVQDLSLWLLFLYTDVPINGRWGNYSGVTTSVWREQFIKDHLQEIRDRRIKLLQDFTYLKVRNCFNPGGGLNDMDCYGGESYLDFLRKAAKIPCVQWEAEQNIREITHREAYLKAHPGGRPNSKPTEASTTVPTEERLRELRASKPQQTQPPSAAQTAAHAEVVFHPVRFQRGRNADPPPTAEMCFPTTDGVDLFIGQGALYLMQKKDQLLRLPLPESVIRVRSANIPQNVCFDGRFVWVAGRDPDRFLAVIDPPTQRIWKFTANDDLPPMNEGSVAPVAPGKVCVAGYFGRTWCAIATFDPEKGKSLKVFYEAREVPDARHFSSDPNPNIATMVGPMRTLTIPALAGKPAEQKVLMIAHIHRSLLIDPQKCVVERVVPGALCTRLFCVHEGAIYWSQPGGPGPMFRSGFPDFKHERVRGDGSYGPSVVYNGRIYMWNGPLFVAKSFKDKFQPLRGELPDPNVHWWEVYPAVSRHYGLMVFTRDQAYRVEFQNDRFKE